MLFAINTITSWRSQLDWEGACLGKDRYNRTYVIVLLPFSLPQNKNLDGAFMTKVSAWVSVFSSHFASHSDDKEHRDYRCLSLNRKWYCAPRHVIKSCRRFNITRVAEMVQFDTTASVIVQTVQYWACQMFSLSLTSNKKLPSPEDSKISLRISRQKDFYMCGLLYVSNTGDRFHLFRMENTLTVLRKLIRHVLSHQNIL